MSKAKVYDITLQIEVIDGNGEEEWTNEAVESLVEDYLEESYGINKINFVSAHLNTVNDVK
jgi:hypothetical protein